MNTHFSDLHEISGWILPDGRWYPTKEWWHISGLYDLKDSLYPPLQTADAKRILHAGEEESIRNLASNLSFIKISRGQIDGEHINLEQLVTLKKLLTLIDPESEFDVLNAKVGFVKKVSVQRILKLKNAENFFLH